jgi:hypothetical protein
MTDGACEIIEAFDQMFVEKGKGKSGMPPMDLYQTNRGHDGRGRQLSGTKVLLNSGQEPDNRVKLLDKKRT